MLPSKVTKTLDVINLFVGSHRVLSVGGDALFDWSVNFGFLGCWLSTTRVGWLVNFGCDVGLFVVDSDLRRGRERERERKETLDQLKDF